MSDFDDLDLARLRERRSAKWTVYPADVLPAWVAEMDFPLAPPLKAALREAIERDDCGYANAGDLMEAFAAFAGRRFGWNVAPRRAFLVPDVMVGVAEVLRAVSAPGAAVVINSPVYPPFAAIAGEVERRIENVPLLRTAAGWTLDLDGLERAFADGARVYLLCSPHNPVGRCWTSAELTAVAALAQRYGVTVLADEIHAPLTLPGARHVPFAALAEPLGVDSVVLTAASKAWNIAGLKSALAIAGSEAMLARLRGMPVELRYRAGHLGVLASIAAFRAGDAWLDGLLAQLDRNRAVVGTLLAQRLPGARYLPPEASYLAWIDTAGLPIDGDPSAFFLTRGRVALTRGADFGPGGERFVRLNMGTSPGLLAQAIDRMAEALRARDPAPPASSAEL